ncbi:phosphoribosyltransferase [Mycolicibacter heraklionensis]|uniref:Phosphoribosyltransferase n=1 Tax=Mycolicibacter heraklionensis TaxID=512402 RepID=A0ABR5FH79_9MYCO|nr:ComF family protein [Mycolicibacter heraklionensis]KLO29760.1 phosphoribosyltransferase [Mycolicibacter heraklionensis]
MLDVVLPLQCGGCGAPGSRWCAVCAAQLAVGPDEPRVITPRLDPQVPVFALGRYAGARRQAIVAAKERGRSDLIAPLASALGVALQRLLCWQMVDLPLTIIPAPTRRSAARRRGGDPIARIAASVAGHQYGVTVVPALRMRELTRDSVGLGSGARERNVAGRVLLRRRGLSDLSGAGDVLVVDDVVTTGATLAESVRVLRRARVPVSAALVIASV